MDKKEAIQFLRRELSEMILLKDKYYKNNDLELWVSKMENVIDASLDAGDYKTFTDAHPRYSLHSDPSESELQSRYNEVIAMRETAIKKIIQKYEVLVIEEKPAAMVEPKNPGEVAVYLFDKMQFHLKVVEVSRKLFEDGHYRDAIYRAFVEVNSFVKAKSGKQLDGRGLMSTVFSLDNPIIKINPLKTQTDRDEQEGFMFLFMGAMEGIRNPKAHENIIQNNPYRTLEYLSIASLLMKIADEGKLA